jgi:polyketide synthase 13
MNATTSEYQTWLQDELAKLMELSAEQLPVNAELTSLGVDSLVAVRLAGLISDRLGATIDPMAMFDHPTIESLATYLVDQQVQAESVATEAQ